MKTNNKSPSAVLVSSKVADMVPSQTVCSQRSCGPTAASGELKAEESHFNNLPIRTAHAQTHCTSPTAWWSNLTVCWKSLQLSATTTRPRFLSRSLVSHKPQAQATHKVRAILPISVNYQLSASLFKSMQATNVLELKHRAQPTQKMLAFFSASLWQLFQFFLPWEQPPPI